GLTDPVVGGGNHRIVESLDAAIGARNQPTGNLADMGNAERIDEAVELHRAACFDGSKQLCHGRLPPPFPRLEPRRGAAVAFSKGEDVLRRLDQSVVVEGFDVLLAKALDIEGVARHEMLEALYALRRADQSADAASDGILFPRRGIDLAHGVATTGRT